LGVSRPSRNALNALPANVIERTKKAMIYKAPK
jgi:hypothetical protein